MSAAEGRRRPVRTYTALTDLGAARARATSYTPGHVVVTFGDTDALVGLDDTAAVLRGLLTDALAQLDAIAPEEST